MKTVKKYGLMLILLSSQALVAMELKEVAAKKNIGLILGREVPATEQDKIATIYKITELSSKGKTIPSFQYEQHDMVSVVDDEGKSRYGVIIGIIRAGYDQIKINVGVDVPLLRSSDDTKTVKKLFMKLGDTIDFHNIPGATSERIVAEKYLLPCASLKDLQPNEIIAIKTEVDEGDGVKVPRYVYGMLDSLYLKAAITIIKQGDLYCSEGSSNIENAKPVKLENIFRFKIQLNQLKSMKILGGSISPEDDANKRALNEEKDELRPGQLVAVLRSPDATGKRKITYGQFVGYNEERGKYVVSVDTGKRPCDPEDIFILEPESEAMG